MTKRNFVVAVVTVINMFIQSCDGQTDHDYSTAGHTKIVKDSISILPSVKNTDAFCKQIKAINISDYLQFTSKKDSFFFIPIDFTISQPGKVHFIPRKYNPSLKTMIEKLKNIILNTGWRNNYGELQQLEIIYKIFRSGIKDIRLKGTDGNNQMEFCN